jgi:hypothetical protein
VSTQDLATYDLLVDALDAPRQTPAERAVALDAAAHAMGSRSNPHDGGVTARAARALATALGCLADLERWEADTVSAAVDSDRHRRAAAFKARTVAVELDAADPVLGPVRDILERIAATGDLHERAGLLEDLARIPVPLPLLEPPSAPFTGPRADQEPTPPAPRAAIAAILDGSPVTWAHAVAPGRVHELEVEARVLDWPAEAAELVLRFLSRWPHSAVDVTEIRLARPDDEVDGVRIARDTGHLALHAAAADPTTPVHLTIEGQLVTADGGRAPLRLLGHRELAVRTFDPTTDVITGAPVLDERILAMLAELRDQNVAPHEQQAFGRFLGAMARAGVRIVAEREFPVGSNPSEPEFQAELLKRVAMATELGGRVHKHAWQGGGPTDLAHDGVVAELKVERAQAATLERATNYMAQATQYASAGQRQLSILVILDMTPKLAPPGVLANTIGSLDPALHGLEDPAFPSRVAVVIVNGNLPVPSAWSS